MKRLISVFLTVLMCLAVVVPVTADEPEDLFVYSVSKGEVTLVTYTGTKTEVEVPDTLDGKNVVAIGDECFAKSAVRKVKIASSIQSIGKGAFADCASLTEIILPDSITRIEEDTFVACSALVSIDLPAQILTIGSCAFSGCSSLKNVTIHEGLEEIMANAFDSCTAMTSIQLPASLTKIGEQAFNGCKNLLTYVIPNPNTIIGEKAIGYTVNAKAETVSRTHGIIWGVLDSTAMKYADANKQTFYVIDHWANPFDDIKEGDWFFDAVQFVCSNALFIGTSSATFSPNDKMTRGMYATVLYRYADAASGDKLDDISDWDCDKNAYYYDAVAWAKTNGIINGTSESAKTFEPDRNISRQEIVAILYRYAQTYLHLDVSNDADFSKFSDSKDISTYAVPAMKWAVSVGIIHGNPDGTILPLGNATRAEVATMVDRFDRYLTESKKQ